MELLLCSSNTNVAIPSVPTAVDQLQWWNLNVTFVMGGVTSHCCNITATIWWIMVGRAVSVPDIQTVGLVFVFFPLRVHFAGCLTTADRFEKKPRSCCVFPQMSEYSVSQWLWHPDIRTAWWKTSWPSPASLSLREQDMTFIGKLTLILKWHLTCISHMFKHNVLHGWDDDATITTGFLSSALTQIW